MLPTAGQADLTARRPLLLRNSQGKAASEGGTQPGRKLRSGGHGHPWEEEVVVVVFYFYVLFCDRSEA